MYPLQMPPQSLFIVMAALVLLLLVVAPVLVSSSLSPAYAHFEHFTHYNNRGGSVGPYYAYEALEPDYAGPNEPVAIMFSVQDRDGQDTYDIETMVEVYSANTGDRLKAWPWTMQEIGDFYLFYNFPQIGSYQIVLSVANEDKSMNPGGIDPPRTALSSSTGCNCDRVIFNVSITENFGTIWNTMMLVAVGLPLSVFGGVLFWNYRNTNKRRRDRKSAHRDTVRYIVMLAAIAGGIVHLAVYSEHASLRLEYSIFLLVAAGMQVVYGVVYTILTLSGQGVSESARQYYQKKMVVNLFGLVGTGILLGLYAYSVILPPPLSPNDQPESISIAGILAKSIEVFTVVGILYLMRLEKGQLVGQVKEPA
jgi:ABC-type sugar transport system permease subunit